MMTIGFYLNDEESTPIQLLHKMESNPFKEGDIVNLSVHEISPKILSGYPESISKNIEKENEEKRKKFNLKKVKLIKEVKFLKIDSIVESVVIEYFCEIIDR